MIAFFERVYFNPRWYDYLFIFLLTPFAFVYAIVVAIKRVLSKKESFGLPIVSIGNLIVGGSGKTPFAISLIQYLQSKGEKKIFYISRGYGRESKGLVVVKNSGVIECRVEISGDEAMLVAKETNANVIVSEDRSEAIKRAKSLGAKIIILDDAFSKSNIKKFDILLQPETVKNYLPLPAGPFREFAFAKKYANLFLKESIDFKRVVSFENLTSKMLLVTSIANPKRLEPFLPKGVVGAYYIPDHSYFDKEKLLDKMKEYSVTSLLVTQKDYVKLEHFKLPLSIIKLQLEIDNNYLDRIYEYIKEEACKQK